MDKLKELLGEELFEQVKEKLGDKKIDIVNDGRWIPKTKFDEVNNEKNEYKAQVEELNEALGELKGKAKDGEEVEARIQELEEMIENKEKEITNIRKTNAIKFEIMKANPRDVADILPHIDNEVIKIENGEVTGLKEQLEKLKEEKGYLFKDDTPAGTGGSKGNLPRSSGKLFTKEEIENMTPEQINENWDTISKLMESGEI